VQRASSRGTLDLLDAFARLPRDLATLHLVGRTDVDWRHGARVARRLARSDVAERVVDHGPVGRERLADLYGSADVSVLPSYRERAAPSARSCGPAREGIILQAPAPSSRWRRPEGRLSEQQVCQMSVFGTESDG
jgi:glycosyltransferase involved in cell wall biosynthesis